MPKLRITILILAAITTAVVDGASVEAQTMARSDGPAIAVRIALQKDKVPLGQSPWVFLNVENLTDHEIVVGEPLPHVEGEKGELPMKPQSGIVTDTLHPRIPRLRNVVYAGPWTIAPRDSSILKYQLAYYFDLSARGQYTVYMEVMDPSTHKLLRTNRAKFEMQ